MRRRLLAVVGLLAATALPLAAGQAPAPKTPDVAGKWNVAMELSIGTSTPTLVLKQDGETLTGTYTSSRYGDAKLTGTVDGKRQITFTVALDAEGQAIAMIFAGEVAADGQTIAKGTVSIEGLGDGTWVAKRGQ